MIKNNDGIAYSAQQGVVTDGITMTGAGTSSSPLGVAQDMLYFGCIRQPNAITVGNARGISATVPPGYQFVCWLGASPGVRATCYISPDEGWTASNNIVWVPLAPQTSNNSYVQAWYMCVKQ